MSSVFHQLVSKSTALLFLYILFPICFGLPCGDYASEKELRFTCRLDQSAYFEDLTINPPAAQVKRMYFGSTAVLVDYFENRHTALFLTAAHSVSVWEPVRLRKSKGICVFMPHDVCYSRAPLDNFALGKQIKDYKGYANISIVCYDLGSNLPIESMYAYPVELAPGNELLYLPKARQYETPFELDVAVVVAAVNDEFIKLWEAGSLGAIMLPPMKLDEDFISQFTYTKIDFTDYYKVRVGGSGSCDPIVCDAQYPPVPLFSNFGIDKFVKLVDGHIDLVNNSTRYNWRFTWPLTVEDGVISLKAKPCEAFHLHAPACGLRSTCFGDSGGPAYLSDSETPTLIGIISRGHCTHVQVRPDRVVARVVLLTNTEVQTWYNKIKRLVESGVIPVNKTICDM